MSGCSGVELSGVELFICRVVRVLSCSGDESLGVELFRC